MLKALRILVTYVRRRIKSITYALDGILILFKTEDHAKLHLLAATLVVFVATSLNVSKSDWLFLLIAIFLVIISEGFNTAIEEVVDLAEPNVHPKAKRAKDIAAGSVLLASFAAVIIGGIIFLPYLLA